MAYSSAIQLMANSTGTGAAATFPGGPASLVVNATFGGGNVQLQLQAADGNWVNAASAVTAAGLVSLTLPAGNYRVVATTATAVYATLAVVPY